MPECTQDTWDIMSGTMSRMVTLPADVTEDGAKASFRNGIREVWLKRRFVPQKSLIAIEQDPSGSPYSTLFLPMS
jgi:HSP20 family molecular chaperone IbpA